MINSYLFEFHYINKINYTLFPVFYSYDGKVGFNEELTFEEIANREDKRRNKMNILVYDNNQTIINNNINK